MLEPSRYEVVGLEELPSPSLIYFLDIIAENTRKAIEMAGSAARLWPHVKSHKMREMVILQREMGIERFKCATLVEAEMVASCGDAHVLLAYPLVGPNIAGYLALCAAYPACSFYAIGDDAGALGALSAAAVQAGLSVRVLVDLNLGMNRTGIAPQAAEALCRHVHALPGLELAGLHAYDGDRHESVLAERELAARPGREAVKRLRQALLASGLPCPCVVMGGTPTFPIHAAEEDVFLSPGTVFTSDWGYCQSYPDLSFRPGAALLARVVSRPSADLFTLDVGTKAIACEMAGARGIILGLEDAAPVSHNEEHWVFRAPETRSVPNIGDLLLIFPTHICPTNALHEQAYVVAGGQVVDTWPVAARGRQLRLPE